VRLLILIREEIVTSMKLSSTNLKRKPKKTPWYTLKTSRLIKLLCGLQVLVSSIVINEKMQRTNEPTKMNKMVSMFNMKDLAL
jgi:hypothetical protein